MTTTITDRNYGQTVSAAIKAPVNAVATVNVNVQAGGVAPITTIIGQYTPNPGDSQTAADRILLSAQNNATENGIWSPNTGAWVRTGDFDGNRDAVSGTLIIYQNALLGSLFYQVQAPTPTIQIGVTPITIVPIGSFPATPFYARTTAEIAQGIVPVSPQYEPNNVFRFMTAGMIADIQARAFTAAIQNPGGGALTVTQAVNNALQVGRIGSRIKAPAGGYYINGTIVQYPGQTVKGDGWATTPLTFSIAGGSEFRQFSGTNIACFSQSGTSDANQNENGGLEDLAITNSIPSGPGIAYFNTFARFTRLQNVYVAGFATAYQFTNTSWLVKMDHCKAFDFTSIGLQLESACDDNEVSNCQLSGYHAQAIPLVLSNASVNTKFDNVYLQGCNFACQMNQGDDGAGNVLPMSARFSGLLMEDVICAGFAINSTLTNPASPTGLTGNKGHPVLQVDGMRAFNSGNFKFTLAVTSASGTGTSATLNFAAVPAYEVPPIGSQIDVTLAGAYNAANAVITASSTTSVSYASAATGAQATGTITYGAQPNHGQSVVYAQFASQISVRDLSYASGFSYATTICGTAVGSGQGFYNYFYNPSGAAPVGPVLWEQSENNCIFAVNGANNGDAAFRGTTGAITRIPGDRALVHCSNATAGNIAYTAGNTTLIPFQTKISDFGQWLSASNSGCIIPLRNRKLRFRAQAYTASAPAGQYTLLLYKNGVLLATLAAETVGAGPNPFAWGGEAYDTPNGSTDYYQVFVINTQNCTIDSAAGHTWFVAEVAGT